MVDERGGEDAQDQGEGVDMAAYLFALLRIEINGLLAALVSLGLDAELVKRAMWLQCQFLPPQLRPFQVRLEAAIGQVFEAVRHDDEAVH